MRVLDARQMREADRRTIEEHGVPSLVLMENAGGEVVRAVVRRYPQAAGGRVVVVCGKGNNGGDGFVVARLLAERGADVRVVLVARAADVDGDARLNLERIVARGLTPVEVTDSAGWTAAAAELAQADLVVDALFGTGLTGPLRGLAAEVVRSVNQAGRLVVSVDLPSGLSADTGAVDGEAIRAHLTVTFASPKLPLVLSPASDLAGELVVANIGIPSDVIDALPGPVVTLLRHESVAPMVGRRAAGSHKGTYGHVLVVAGSRGKTGAAHLSAMAALRSGAGLVTIATPASVQPVVATMGAEYMTVGLPDRGGALTVEGADEVLRFPADVVAVGPGVGQAPETISLVRRLVAESARPLVVDADGLNAFADVPEALAGRPDRPIVITPHPGEMARLTGMPAAEVQRRRFETARDLAAGQGLHVVLKGHHTVVAAPDGRTAINTTGNPGMATGGTGDVLTGIVAAWLAQTGDPMKAASVAVYLHGRAGDLAAARVGEVGLIASDLLPALATAALELAGPRRPEREPA